MIITWAFATVLAEAAAGHAHPIVMSVPAATMTCMKEGDHLVCILPLGKELADEARHQAGDPVATARTYKPSPSTPALPNPEVLDQIRIARANIALAKALLPKATTPEETVLAEQMLYWANEQYRTAEALLHTVQERLHRAPDPFDGRQDAKNAEPMALCQADIAEACDDDARQARP